MLRISSRFLLKEEIIVTTHLRNAAGACALSIGLLVCSSAGAIAVADTETGGVSDSPGSDTNTADRTPGTSTSDGPTNTAESAQDETGDDNTVTVGTTSGTTNQQSSSSTVGTEITTSEEEDDVTDVTALDLGGAEAGSVLTSTVVKMPVEQNPGGAEQACRARERRRTGVQCREELGCPTDSDP